MTPTYRLDVYEDDAGLWRWRALAANNRVVADSGESYTRRSDALAAARRFSQANFTVRDTALETR